MKTSLLLLVTVCIPWLSVAETWIVDQGGGGDFTTIQAALVAAATGDEILVHPGTYIENVDFLGKNVWLHSSGGWEVTTIDGRSGPPDQASCVVFVSGETRDAILEGFTLTGGRGMYDGEYQQGGGVLCIGSSPTLRSLHFSNNVAENGGACSFSNSSPEITDCEFVRNVAQNLGGCIWSTSAGCNITVQRCLFESNWAGGSGGVLHFGPVVGLVEDCTFRDNEAQTGGAISLGVAGPSFVVRDCVFDSNRAYNGDGGAIRLHEASPAIEGCVFYDNTATRYGGALLSIDGSMASADRCTFCRNGATYGGNIGTFGNASPSLSRCIIAQATSGGGAYAYDGLIGFYCCDAWANTGGNYVGFPDPTGTHENISLDPVFCNPSADDFTVADISPCAEQNNPMCGQIGALGVGCGGCSPVRLASWGELKVTFRLPATR